LVFQVLDGPYDGHELIQSAFVNPVTFLPWSRDLRGDRMPPLSDPVSGDLSVRQAAVLWVSPSQLQRDGLLGVTHH